VTQKQERLASYHVHTTFCDGSETPEAMVKAALSAGMTDIGFSAHAAWPFATTWHMNATRYDDYLAEIQRLKTAYSGQIAISTGFEADWIDGTTAPDSACYGQFNADYLIGSVHFVSARKGTIAEPWSIDAPTEDVRRGIERCFAGDGKRATIAYWGTVRDMVRSCDFDIVGHLDVLRKRNGDVRFFDESAAWYRAELKETVRTIARAGKIVELNTGAIARKAMDAIYPSDELLALLRKADVPVMLNSDAHAGATLTCAYERARTAARSAGYEKFMYLENKKWVARPF
jgi:histidinol-phosphatase (PHP family)